MKRLSHELSCKVLGWLLVIITIQLGLYAQWGMYGLLVVSYVILFLLFMVAMLSWVILIVWLLVGGEK